MQEIKNKNVGGKMTNETVALKKYAYNEIKRKILNCDYAPGCLLNEQFLTSELNISRTPIREALNRLDQEGLIRILSKKGILVSNISIIDLTHIYQVRIELEPYVVRMAGPHLDLEKLMYYRKLFYMESDDKNSIPELETDVSFHGYLTDNCHNKYIHQLMKKVLDENERIMIFTRNKVRIEHARNEHLKIIDLLMVGDYEAASRVMRTHIENCRDSAVAYFLDQDKLFEESRPEVELAAKD
jgi:DNA-binding GntR family transcriptional regulator